MTEAEKEINIEDKIIENTQLNDVSDSISTEIIENEAEKEINIEDKIIENTQLNDDVSDSISTEIIENNSEKISNRVPDVDTNKNKTKKNKNPKTEEKLELRGLPKSGRFWKTKKQKFLTVKKSIYKRSFDQKLKLQNDMKHIKEVSRSIKEDRKRENEDKKKRREENAQKKLENERKSEIVQVIKNSAKIKRMKKKQLRQIEKRDLSILKVV